MHVQYCTNLYCFIVDGIERFLLNGGLLLGFLVLVRKKVRLDVTECGTAHMESKAETQYKNNNEHKNIAPFLVIYFNHAKHALGCVQ